MLYDVWYLYSENYTPKALFIYKWGFWKYPITIGVFIGVIENTQLNTTIKNPNSRWIGPKSKGREGSWKIIKYTTTKPNIMQWLLQKWKLGCLFVALYLYFHALEVLKWARTSPTGSKFSKHKMCLSFPSQKRQKTRFFALRAYPRKLRANQA